MPAAASVSPALMRRRLARASPTRAASERRLHSAREPERRVKALVMEPALSRGTPRKVTVSREAWQLLTTIFMGTTEATPGMREIRETYDSGRRLEKGQKRFWR